MTAQLIDGKSIAASLRQQIAKRVTERRQQGLRTPGLAVILVGSDPASQVYVSHKRKDCEEVGFISKAYDLPSETTQQALTDLIDSLNDDPKIDGILLQLPLPEHLDAVLLRALAKRPQERFTTWADFASALLAVQHALPATRPQDSEAQRFALLRALPFFADFHDVALWELMRLGRWRWAPKGKVILQEGLPGDSFYVLVEGQVSITREGWHLSTLGPGATLGEMTYLQPDNRVRSATAVAQTDALVIKVPNPALREASADLQSRFDKAFIKVLVSRLAATSKQLGAADLGSGAD